MARSRSMTVRLTTSRANSLSRHGYTVLQAVREWEKTKAPFRGKKTADVIAEMIAAKRREQLSGAVSGPSGGRLEIVCDRGARGDREGPCAAHQNSFLNGCEVGPRRWNNLRDQVVTLFRFARSERYLPKDRTTEAEDVAKMKVARKTVDMFTPEELQIVLENTRPVWLPWVLISAYAGVRTFEVLRMDWAMIRWEQKLIDLPPEVTKVNERRIIPMCDTLIGALAPWREAIGSVCEDKIPQREIEQIIAKVKKTHPTFRWKHNALRHAYGSYRTALTQNVPAGRFGNGQLGSHGKAALLGGEDFRGRAALVWDRVAAANKGAREQSLPPLGGRSSLTGVDRRFAFHTATAFLRRPMRCEIERRFQVSFPSSSLARSTSRTRYSLPTRTAGSTDLLIQSRTAPAVKPVRSLTPASVKIRSPLAESNCDRSASASATSMTSQPSQHEESSWFRRLIGDGHNS